jgi:hypothetical protein
VRELSHAHPPPGRDRAEGEGEIVEDQNDPLAQFGLEAIDLRWTLKDIIAKRWMLAPPNPEHLAKLIDLGLVEMRDGRPFATIAGQDAAWI